MVCHLHVSMDGLRKSRESIRVRKLVDLALCLVKDGPCKRAVLFRTVFRW